MSRLSMLAQHIQVINSVLSVMQKYKSTFSFVNKREKIMPVVTRGIVLTVGGTLRANISEVQSP